jgi:uncharacterized protein YjbI with pentapeptide repeats
MNNENKHPTFSEEQIRAKAYEILKARNGDESSPTLEDWNVAIANLREAQKPPVFHAIQAIIKWIGIKEKKGWDFLQLLIVPLVLTTIAFLLQQGAKQREEQLSADKARQESFSNYLNQMSDLLLNKGLRKAKPDSEVFILAQSRTTTTLRELDPKRQDLLIQFLKSVNLYTPKKGYSLLENAYFGPTNLSKLNLSLTNLFRANFNGAVLNQTDFMGTFLICAQFQNASLYKANLNGAELNRADFKGAVLNEADFFYAKLNETNFYQASLNRTDLNEAELNKSQPLNVKLIKASLDRANLNEAQLYRADLSYASLVETDLYKANLSGANLNGTNLNRANLSGANFKDSINLKPESIQSACFWEEAQLDETLHKKIKALTPKEIDCRGWKKKQNYKYKPDNNSEYCSPPGTASVRSSY